MTNDNPKPYIDVAGLIWDGFSECTESDVLKMIKTGYYMYAWGELQVSKGLMSEYFENCKCKAIFEKNGMRVGPCEGAVRVDERCGWCKDRLDGDSK